jgi:hypothetical protein
MRKTAPEAIWALDEEKNRPACKMTKVVDPTAVTFMSLERKTEGVQAKSPTPKDNISSMQSQ